MMTLTQLEQVRPLLIAHNRRIERSRDEYRTHPFAVCVGWLHDDEGNEEPCTNAAHHSDRLCNTCRRAAAKARREARRAS